MEHTKLSIEISEDEYKQLDEKCLELQKKYSCAKVHYTVQLKTDGTNERVCAFIKEPSFTDKLILMSKVKEDNQYLIADEIRQIYQLRDESDSLTYDDSYIGEPYKLGVVHKCLDIISIVRDRAKKK